MTRLTCSCTLPRPSSRGLQDKQLDRASAVVCAGHGRTVWRVVFARDGLLASASGDMSIRLWNSVTGACIMELKSHEAAVQGLAFSLSGALLASSSTDGCIIVWDSKTGEGGLELPPCGLMMSFFRLRTLQDERTPRACDVTELSWRHDACKQFV